MTIGEALGAKIDEKTVHATDVRQKSGFPSVLIFLNAQFSNGLTFVAILKRVDVI